MKMKTSVKKQLQNSVISQFSQFICIVFLLVSMIHFRSPSIVQQYKEPTLDQSLKKLSKNLKDLICKQQDLPFELASISQIFNPQNGKWDRLVTMWQRQQINYEVWWEIGYLSDVNTLEMVLYLTKNFRLGSVTGVYSINLAVYLLERYSCELFDSKQSFQFNINPLTGAIKISNKMLIKQQQYKIQVEKSNYFYAIICQLKQMLGIAQRLFQIQQYLINKRDSLPNYSFRDLQHQTPQKQLPPSIFLKAIHKSLQQVSPNCEQSLQEFGNIQASEFYVKKCNQNLPEPMARVLKMMGKKYKARNFEEIQEYDKDEMTNEYLTDLLGKIYDTTIPGESAGNTEKVVKKIIIKSAPNTIRWKKFASGGFGLIEKAHVQYELSDFEGKNKEFYVGEIARKSDIKSGNKLNHQIKFLHSLKNEQHQNVLPYYLSDQPAHKKYIFSKYEPNLSLDSYLNSNRKTISLQTLIKFMENTAKGLIFLQERKIVHLDVKPNNIIITRDLIAKISDFGEAYHMGQSTKQYKRGFTVPYVSPERLDGCLNSKVDVYSLGVTMFKVFFDRHIWGDIGNKKQFLQALLAPQKMLLYGASEVIGALAYLSLRCVHKQQEDRPTLFYTSAILAFARFYLHSLIFGGYTPIN